MFKFIRKKMNKKGFTLVELLVVIAVLGIIAGIAIPRMSGVTDGFRLKADEETARNLARQVQVRIQVDIIDIPDDDAAAVVITTTDDSSSPATWFGEEFGTIDAQKPQTLDNGFFVITVDHTTVSIFVSATRDTVPTDAVAIQTLAHGGVIE